MIAETWRNYWPSWEIKKTFFTLLLVVVFVTTWFLSENAIMTVVNETRSNLPLKTANHSNVKLNMLNSTVPKIYIRSFGRMGNKLLQITALYALAHTYKKIPVFVYHRRDPVILNGILKTFPHIMEKIIIADSIPVGTKYISTKNINKFYNTILTSTEDVQIEEHFFMYHFYKYKSDIFYMLECSTEIQRESDEVMYNISTLVNFTNPKQAVVYVGIHVRRGDKAWHPVWNDTLPKPDYFITAMDNCRHKYHPKKTVFLISSDSIDWCKEQFGHLPNVHFLGGSQFVDMATLRKCDHTILSEGTYSRWVGVFTKGDVYCHKPMCPFFKHVIPQIKAITGKHIVDGHLNKHSTIKQLVFPINYIWY